MPYLKNRRETNCYRCGKHLKEQEGFIIPRNYGYEISCGLECLKSMPLEFSLGSNFRTTIEVRKDIPQINGVSKEEPYKVSAMGVLMNSLRVHYGKSYSDRLNRKTIKFTDGRGVDRDGTIYIFVKASAPANKNNVRKILIRTWEGVPCYENS